MSGAASRRWRTGSQPLLWPALALAALLAINALFDHGFLVISWRAGHLSGSLVDVLNRAAPLALVASGMTLVIALRGIDISVGAVLAIAATVAALVINGSSAAAATGGGPHLAVALSAALAAAALCGLWNGLLVVGAGLQPIVATLVLMVAGRGAAQLLAGGQIITIYNASYADLGNGFLLGVPIAVVVAAAIVLLLAVTLRCTALDLFIRAIGCNPAAARNAGIRAGLITMSCYVFCALCAGCAGVLVSANVRSADASHAGELIELDAILAVTLGGTSLAGGHYSLAGTLIGALIIQTMTAMIYTLGVPPETNLVVKAAVVIAVMLLQSPHVRRGLRRLATRHVLGEGA